MNVRLIVLLGIFVRANSFGFTKQQIDNFFTNTLKFQRPLWTGPNLQRSDRRNFKLIFLLSLISLETSSEIFVRIPPEILYGSAPVPIVSIAKEDTNDVIIFPGAGGPDRYTDQLKQNILASDKKKGIKRPVYVYDWLKWRGNFIRAAFDSQNVGRTIGTQLAEQSPKLKNIQVIGISVGAFAADSCAKAYKELAEHPGTVHLTLLDPFTSKGIFGYGWGLKNFGAGIDVVEQYMNADDQVPTTNDPVLNAYTFDVTASEDKKQFQDNYHSWPVAYLANHWETEVDGEGNILEPAEEKEPKGGVAVVP